MERRKEPRFADDTPVTVTVLDPAKPCSIRGRVENMSGTGLSLRVFSPIACGTPVKVEGADMLVLGEVCRSQAAVGRGDDVYEVAVQIAQALASLSSLDRFNRALLGAGARQEDNARQVDSDPQEIRSS